MLAPGFIDMHSHSDWRLWDNRRAESKIRQGVTTEVVGNCGFSPAPVSTEFVEDLRGFALYIPTGHGLRVALGRRLSAGLRPRAAPRSTSCSSSATARCASPPWASRGAPPTAAELTQMQRLHGATPWTTARGGCPPVSSTRPGSYATTEEIVARRASAAARYRGFYASHIRGEGATLLDAVREAIRVGREARRCRCR